MKIKLILFFFIISINSLKANLIDGGKDTNYIKPFKHSIALTFASSHKFLNLEMYNLNSGHDLLEKLLIIGDSGTKNSGYFYFLIKI